MERRVKRTIGDPRTNSRSTMRFSRARIGWKRDAALRELHADSLVVRDRSASSTGAAAPASQRGVCLAAWPHISEVALHDRSPAACNSPGSASRIIARVRFNTPRRPRNTLLRD